MSSPLLDVHREEKTVGKYCLQRLIDVEEAKVQFLFSVPMVLTNISFSAVTLVSVMFAGHLGDLELAGSTLGNSWAYVTGFALVRLIDVEEAKVQLLFSVPMVLTNISFSAVTLVSVMFAGHLGDLELAGSTLGNSWGYVTGFALMVYYISCILYTVSYRTFRYLLFFATADHPLYASSTLHYLAIHKTGLSGALETLCGQGYVTQDKP